MKAKTSLVLGPIWKIAIAVLISGAALPAAAQTCTVTNAAGNNAIYGNCSGSTVKPQGSAAYIDASAVTAGADFCATLFNIIRGSSYPGYPANGAVIDARGIVPTACGVNSTPWVGLVGSTVTATTNPATILLPAGTISISTTWILPKYSRIVGEGPALTTITPASGFAAGQDGVDAMIEMGTVTTNTLFDSFCSGTPTTGPGNDCVGVGVQDLTLNLAGLAISYGILNPASQETSYVDNVTFNNVGNTSSSNSTLALAMVDASGGSGASNSGPYSNLVCNIASGAASATNACVSLQAHTRGVHGISCYGNGTPTAAIYLDSDMNSIEDVYVNGFDNGVLIGSGYNGSNTALQAPSNLLFNISGGSSVTELVHITDNTTTSSNPICPQHYTACDETIMNVTAAAGTTIQDDIMSTTLTVTGSDSSVGMYFLGEQIGGNTTPAQYTRFTSSPRVPTWGSGTSTPSSTCSGTGSLYSNVSSSAGGLYACIGSWTKIP